MRGLKTLSDFCGGGGGGAAAAAAAADGAVMPGGVGRAGGAGGSPSGAWDLKASCVVTGDFRAADDSVGAASGGAASGAGVLAVTGIRLFGSPAY